MNGYFHTLYCRSLHGRYSVIAKTLPYLKVNKPTINEYKFYYLNGCLFLPEDYKYKAYSEQDILRLIRLKNYL